MAMRDSRRILRNEKRPKRRLGIWCLAAALLLCLLLANLWLHPSPGKAAADVPLAALNAAYQEVTPGETVVRDLAKLGFDAGRPGVQRLSYLGLMERYAPHDSGLFDALDPAAQKCLATPEGCTAYLFRLKRAQGSQARASFGFVNAAEAGTAGAVEVLFLIHDGRVVHKAMSGV